MTTHELNMNLALWSGVFFRLAMMMLVLGAVVLYAHFLNKNTGRQPPRGVVILGVLLIWGTLYKLWGFTNYAYYRFMFQQLSDQAILLRFIGSVGLRVAGLIIATGVLMMKEPFRKGFLALGLFTLCALYWKHPLYVFENIARQTEVQLSQSVVPGELADPMRPRIVMFVNYAVDVIFYVSALLYLTRARVKERFQ